MPPHDALKIGTKQGIVEPLLINPVLPTSSQINGSPSHNALLTSKLKTTISSGILSNALLFLTSPGVCYFFYIPAPLAQ